MLTQDQLYEYKISPSSASHLVHAKSGRPAFISRRSSGWYGIVNKKRVSARLVVWALHYDMWPARPVYHSNGDQHDNTPANLTFRSILRPARQRLASPKGFHLVPVGALRLWLRIEPSSPSGLVWADGEEASRHDAHAGEPALVDPERNGGWFGRLAGRKVRAHLVVWALHHGAWPEHRLTHRDGNKRNNTPDNLIRYGRTRVGIEAARAAWLRLSTPQATPTDWDLLDRYFAT